MSDRKTKTGFAIFIIIVLVAIIVTIISVVIISDGRSRDNNTEWFSPKTLISNRRPKGPYIAEVAVTGVISEGNDSYNQKWLLSTITELADDTNNVGLLLFIDSPGGSVYEADEVYLALCDYKAHGKPIYAYLGSLAASGGYYIACAADTIYANRNTLTGSIGVIASQSVDATALLNRIGVKIETFTAGKNKNMLNFNSPLTEEQRNIMLEIAREAYDQFTGIVAESRSLDIAEVRRLADGRLYTAQQAKNNDLIDAIGSKDEALDALRVSCGDSYNVVPYEYTYEPPFMQWLRGQIGVNDTARTLSSVLHVPSVRYPAYLYIE
ncbi:MAG: signal peptide peptidase SppA [Treponema sp.]|nr:signal peptide peptidase SppA [Treponema sp.]